MLKFYWTCNSSANTILKAFAQGLKVKDAELEEFNKLNSQKGNQLRLLHYPEISKEKLDNEILARLPAHQDWGVVLYFHFLLLKLSLLLYCHS